MSGYIMIRKDLLTETRFTTMVAAYLDRVMGVKWRNATAFQLATAKTHVLGALAQLWIFGDTHIRSDNTLDVTVDQIDELVGIADITQLIPGDWLQILDAECVRLPDFLEHNGSTAKKKAKNADRQARHRARHRDDAPALLDESPSNAPALPSQTDPSHPNPAVKKGAAAASRLPTDFVLTPERRAVAEAETLPADRTFEKFCDYWRAASGAGARKHDWDATWRNWCRTEADRSRGSPEAQAAARSTRGKEASWARVKAHAKDVGYPHAPDQHDSPEIYETRVKLWERDQPARPRGPASVASILPARTG